MLRRPRTDCGPSAQSTVQALGWDLQEDRQSESRGKRTKQHFVGRACVFGVMLKAIALEVLHIKRFVVRAARLGKLLGDGVAELSKASVLGPVVKESSAQSMARSREPLHARLVWVG